MSTNLNFLIYHEKSKKFNVKQEKITRSKIHYGEFLSRSPTSQSLKYLSRNKGRINKNSCIAYK